MNQNSKTKLCLSISCQNNNKDYLLASVRILWAFRGDICRLFSGLKRRFAYTHVFIFLFLLISCKNTSTDNKDYQLVSAQINVLNEEVLIKPKETLAVLDSLEKTKIVNAHDSLRMAVLKIKSVCYTMFMDEEKAFSCVNRALKIHFKADNLIRANCYTNLGNYTTIFKGDAGKALRYVEQSDSVLLNTSDQRKLKLKCQNNLCRTQIYRLLDQPGKVYQHALLAMEDARLQNDSNQIGLSALQCILISFEHGDLVSAEKYGLLAEKYIANGRKTGWTALVFQNLCAVYIEKKDYKRAKKYLNKHKDYVAKNYVEPITATFLLVDEAVLDVKEGKLDKAEKLLLEAEKAGNNAKHINISAIASANLVELYALQGNIKEASVFAEKLLSMKDKIYIPWSVKADMFRQLSLYAKKKGDMLKALEYNDSMDVARDSLYSRQRFVLRSVLDAKYETKAKDYELAKKDLKVKI